MEKLVAAVIEGLGKKEGDLLTSCGSTITITQTFSFMLRPEHVSHLPSRFTPEPEECAD